MDENIITDGVSDGLYKLNLDQRGVLKANLGMMIKASLTMWHAHLGHCNYKSIKDLVNKFHLPISNFKIEHCKACVMGKMHQNTYSSMDKDFTLLPLDLLFANVWESVPIKSSNEYWFYLLIVDIASKFNWLFPLQWKSQVKETFMSFHK